MYSYLGNFGNSVVLFLIGPAALIGFKLKNTMFLNNCFSFIEILIELNLF